jgi:hypothetical protein
MQALPFYFFLAVMILYGNVLYFGFIGRTCDYQMLMFFYALFGATQSTDI